MTTTTSSAEPAASRTYPSLRAAWIPLAALCLAFFVEMVDNTLLSIAGRRGDEAYDNPTVLRITARQNKLNFSPGEEYLYSNTGYTLLATVVERATQTPFATFAETIRGLLP